MTWQNEMFFLKQYPDKKKTILPRFFSKKKLSLYDIAYWFSQQGLSKLVKACLRNYWLVKYTYSSDYAFDYECIDGMRDISLWSVTNGKFPLSVNFLKTQRYHNNKFC